MDLQLAVISSTLIIELRRRGRVYIGGAYKIKGFIVIGVCMHSCVFESLCNKLKRISVQIHVHSTRHTSTAYACIFWSVVHVSSRQLVCLKCCDHLRFRLTSN